MKASLLDFMGVKGEELKAHRKERLSARQRKQFGLDMQYDKDYAIQLLHRDVWIFDLRGWPGGQITKAEVKRCFKSGEWNTPSGHFNWVMKGKETKLTWTEFWKQFRSGMMKAFATHINWAKATIEQQKTFESKPEKVPLGDAWKYCGPTKDSVLYAKEKLAAYTCVVNGQKPSMENNQRFRLFSKQTKGG